LGTHLRRFELKISGSQLSRLDAIREKCRVVPVDERMAREYARIRLQLKQRGRPIPENDIWIAATALTEEAVVLTDDAHFAEVQGLQCVKLAE
jgi:tRNA(fMet)-specific endonuclease VapC